MEDKKRKTLFNTGIGIAYLAVHVIYSFIITGIIINTFGSEDNGLVSSIRQILTYAALVDCGLGAACIMSYYAPLAQDNKCKVKAIYNKSKSFFQLVGGVYFLAIIILSIFYPFIVESSHSNNYVSAVFVVVGSCQAFSYFFLEKYKSIITADQRIGAVQLCSLLSDLFTIVVVVITINLKLVNSILGLQIIITSITLLQYFFYRYIVHKYYPWLNNKNVVASDEKEPIKQIGSSFVHMLSQTVSFNTDIILLTIFRSLNEVSKYSVYSMVFAMANSLFGVFTKGIEGSIGSLYNKDKAQFKIRFSQFEFLYLLQNTIILSTILLIMQQFITLYTKAETTFSYWDSNVSLMFVVITYFNTIRNPHAMMIRVSENFSQTKGIFVCEAIINLGVSLLLVSKFGIVGVLCGTLISVLIRDVYVIKFIYQKVIEGNIGGFIKKVAVNFIPISFCALFPLNSILGTPSNYIVLFFYLVIDFIFAIVMSLLINYIFNFGIMKSLTYELVALIKRKSIK